MFESKFSETNIVLGKRLFAGLIWQMVAYLLDNQGHKKKGEAPLNKNSKFLIIEMDTLAKKMTACGVCFLVQGVQDLFLDPLMDRRRTKRCPQ